MSYLALSLAWSSMNQAVSRDSGPDRSSTKTRAGVLLVAILCLSGAVAAAPADFRGSLDEARSISYRDWHQAQVLLDELAPLIDQAELREYVDFHLLQARHLVLADRSEEALARVDGLLALELPDDQRLRALQLSANIGVLLRRYEGAFDSLGQALSIEVDQQDPAARISTLNMAAYMFGRVGEYGRGMDYGERALGLARAMDSRSQACVALQRLAPVYKWAERAEQAEQAYRAGITECIEVGNGTFAAVLQHGLADLLRRGDRLDEALRLAEAAIAALDQTEYPLGEHEARLVRAETLHQLDALPASWPEELAQLTDYFDRQGLWDQRARLEALQAELAEKEGDFERALMHLRRHMQAREAFLGRERSMRLAHLQVEFDSRFQRQEIELLRETTRVAQLEAQAAAQQRQIRSFGLLLIALVFFVLLALLLRAFRGRRRFRDLSRRDGLSGLANHTWFFERAQLLLDRFSRDPGQGRVVLVAADIDHFKRVNDIYGHRVGDGVLGRTARRLREVFPDQALVGRIGGEEFAVLVPIETLNEVLGCIDRFRASDAVAKRSGDPEVTVSFGVSCYRPGDDIYSLRERADRALYQAKQGGRNRYELDPSCLSPSD